MHQSCSSAKVSHWYVGFPPDCSRLKPRLRFDSVSESAAGVACAMLAVRKHVLRTLGSLVLDQPGRAGPGQGLVFES